MNPFLHPDYMWEGHDSCFMPRHGLTSVTSHVSWGEALQVLRLSLLFQLLSKGGPSQCLSAPLLFGEES